MSSFRKFNKSSSPILGTRISIINGQTLTSSGVGSFDELVGGGIPLDRTLLVKSDRYTGYAFLLLKYFLAQGIAHGHTCSLVSLDAPPEDIFSDLMALVPGKSETSLAVDAAEDQDVISAPAAVGRSLGALRRTVIGQVASSSSPNATASSSSQLEIAWRYQQLPKFSTALSSDFKGPNNSTYCHTFDLTKRIERGSLNSSNLFLVGREALNSIEGGKSNFERLYTILEKQILSHKASLAAVTTAPRTILRIAIHNLASPSWGDLDLTQLAVFMQKARILLRGSCAILFITIPAYLYNDYHNRSINPLIRRAEHASDGVIEIESFAGTPNPVDEKHISDYHGMIHPISLFAIETSVQTTRLSTVERHSLGFKVRRKRFLIETFTLPPEEEETPQERQRQANATGKPVKSSASTPGCAPRSNKDPLDF